jgi:nucleoside 2-deoxyribosyltransferase
VLDDADSASSASVPLALRAASLVLLGVFLALLVQASLDNFLATFLTKSDKTQAIHFLVLFRPLRNPLEFLQICQFVVLAVLIVRFYLGAFLLHRTVRRGSAGWALYDLANTVVLFGSFYGVTKTVGSPTTFYIAVVVMHAVDLVWFSPMALMPNTAKALAREYALFDLGTIAACSVFAFVLNDRPWYAAQYMLLAVMLAVSAIDTCRNWRRYLGSGPTRTNVGVAQTVAASPRVYLAAPLFSQAERAWNSALADSLRGRGFIVFLPQEAAGDFELEGILQIGSLFEALRDEISKCNVVVAVFDGADADSGTAWESGFAVGFGIPVIGIRTDLRSTGDDQDGAVNLMLSNSAIQMVHASRLDMDQLANRVAEALQAVSAERKPGLAVSLEVGTSFAPR